MSQKENNKGAIALLVTIIIVLLTLCILFATGIINLNHKINDNNTNEIVDENISNVDDIEYNNFTKEDDEYIYKYTFIKNAEYESKISIEDTYAIGIRGDLGVNIYMLKDGKLYYSINQCYKNNDDDIHCNYTNYNISSSDNNDSLKLYDKLSNIRRIKSINYSSGIDYSVLAITEDGKVYLLSNNNGILSYSIVEEEFSAYAVDDIINYQVTVPSGDIWKVVLKDGTIMEKTIEEK